MSSFHRVLIPVDFSPVTPAVVRCAAELARRYDATIHLLHVHPVIGAGLPEVPVRFGGDMFDESLAQDELKLSAVASELRGAGVKVEQVTMAHGAAAPEILDHARVAQCDLIVMGTHGRTGLARLVMGSVAESVVRQAPCAVLTVRAQAAPT